MEQVRGPLEGKERGAKDRWPLREDALRVFLIPAGEGSSVEHDLIRRPERGRDGVEFSLSL